MNVFLAFGNAVLILVFLHLAGCGGPAAKAKPPPQQTAQTAAPRQPEAADVIIPSFLFPERRTVDDVLQQYGPYAVEQLKPHFQRAGVAYPPREIVLAAYKAERVLELWARDEGGFRLIREYPVLAASGTAGPKLRQGDKQVPEGIYRIEGLNPNSHYHLSMKLDYPNEFDWYHAEQDGRDNPGSDIFIHGKDVSVGCLAIGDAAIEELFVLVAQTGHDHVSVVIAPHDPRLVPLKADREWLPEWTPELYAAIDRELARLAPPLRTSANPAQRTLR